jgi:hypothetical protein
MCHYANLDGRERSSPVAYAHDYDTADAWIKAHVQWPPDRYNIIEVHHVDAGKAS